MDAVRIEIEARESAYLSEFACAATSSEGRLVFEAPDPLRTCFMRDRDRILHSRSFRRLNHKTQVFIDPKGDHYRTRLTHTLEVAQIGRTIGRGLKLNEDLIEAIALGHDLGHTPFGHAGETALDEAIKLYSAAEKPVGFDHAEQSLRIVDVLENLNLSIETREGIGGHRKKGKNLSASDGERKSTLEAAVVRISDRIAYLNHDLDDSLRAGVISHLPKEGASLGADHSARVKRMVMDVIENSQDKPRIELSTEMYELVNSLKTYLFDQVYNLYPVLFPDIKKAQNIVKELFNYFAESDHLPVGFRGVQGAVDYVSGMTDRFAITEFERLFIPNSWANLNS